MILLLSRKTSINFHPFSHSRNSAQQGYEWLLDRVFRRHGAKELANNLLAELSAQSDVVWGRCYRDLPQNASIDVVWVVNGVKDLWWSIRNKGRLKAGQLWAGPNIAVVPQEEGGALLSDSIDRFMAPCKWVADFYRSQAPNLRDKIDLWPVGIDTKFWESATHANARLLVYNKGQHALCREVTATLKSQSIPFSIIRYGSYKPQEYRSLLQGAWGMVWLSSSETEGLAVLEALSMNVPILAWNPGRWTYTSRELGQTFSCLASSVPYFDARCGETFETPERFKEKMALFQQRRAVYQPRQYVLDNHLDLASNLSAWEVFKNL